MAIRTDVALAVAAVVARCYVFRTSAPPGNWWVWATRRDSVRC